MREKKARNKERKKEEEEVEDEEQIDIFGLDFLESKKD